MAQFHCIGVQQHCITWVCVHDTDLALRLVLNYVGSGIGRSPNGITRC